MLSIKIISKWIQECDGRCEYFDRELRGLKVHINLSWDRTLTCKLRLLDCVLSWRRVRQRDRTWNTSWLWPGSLWARRRSGQRRRSNSWRPSSHHRVVGIYSNTGSPISVYCIQIRGYAFKFAQFSSVLCSHWSKL